MARDSHGFDSLTVDELLQDEEWREYIVTGGTGKVVDQIRVVDADHSQWGPFMRPLTDAEVRPWCPKGRPSEAEWRDALKAGQLDYPESACGNCTVLSDGGSPVNFGELHQAGECRRAAIESFAGEETVTG